MSQRGFTLALPADPSALAVVRRRLAALFADLELDQRAAGDVSLAVVEACTNVVRHAYGPAGGSLYVQAAAPTGALVVTVRDDGAGITPLAERPAHWDGLGLGLGLSLIAAVAQQVEIETEPMRGTTLRLTFPCTASGGQTVDDLTSPKA